jgi:hypothetical protein
VLRLEARRLVRDVRLVLRPRVGAGEREEAVGRGLDRRVDAARAEVGHEDLLVRLGAGGWHGEIEVESEEREERRLA